MKKWVRCIVLVCLVFLPSKPLRAFDGAEVDPGAEADGAWGYAAADALWDPTSAYESDQARQVARALAVTTRQGRRIERAIEAGEIQVHVLGEEEFDQRYEVVGGSSYALAFAYGREIFMRANSPSALSDLVHEGTHTLDYLAGFYRGRRILELRAYAYEHQFQKATGAEVQFENLLEVVRFVWRY